jgi:hypothetical protein
MFCYCIQGYLAISPVARLFISEVLILVGKPFAFIVTSFAESLTSFAFSLFKRNVTAAFSSSKSLSFCSVAHAIDQTFFYQYVLHKEEK